MNINTIKIILAAFAVYLSTVSNLNAENFEVWVRPGYDSNVTSSVNDPKADGYINAGLSWSRPTDPEKTLDWTLTGLFSSEAYFKTTEQDFISVFISPGITYSPTERFHINLSPIIEASAVKDTNQSEISLGAGLYLSQQLTDRFYIGEYASYIDSKAKNDIYSQNEFSAGGYIGMNITEKLYAEAGYEYSYGTSYQTSSIPLSKGKGKHSTALNYDVYSDTVNEQAISVDAGLDLTDKVFTSIGYTFTYTEGEVGISRSHDISAGIGYRF